MRGFPKAPLHVLFFLSFSFGNIMIIFNLRKIIFLHVCLVYLLSPEVGTAVDFNVNPVRIFFTEGQKSTILKVTNQSNDSMTLHLKVFTWDQDDDGKDVYTPTEEIIFFPKIVKFEGGEERIIRIGNQGPAGEREKTFRLYLEEIPPSDTSLKGAALRTIMRVGVPVFVEPKQIIEMGIIEEKSLDKGNLSYRVLNQGNAHFIIQNSIIEGFDKEEKSIFKLEFGGWYLLEGEKRSYSATIPEEACNQMTNLTIEVSADRLSLRENLHVLPEMCSTKDSVSADRALSFP